MLINTYANELQLCTLTYANELLVCMLMTHDAHANQERPE